MIIWVLDPIPDPSEICCSPPRGSAATSGGPVLRRRADDRDGVDICYRILREAAQQHQALTWEAKARSIGLSALDGLPEEGHACNCRNPGLEANGGVREDASRLDILRPIRMSIELWKRRA